MTSSILQQEGALFHCLFFCKQSISARCFFVLSARLPVPKESVRMAIPSATSMLRPVSRRRLSLTHLSCAPAGSFREQSIPCSDSRFGMPTDDAVSDGAVSAQAAIRRIGPQSMKSPPLPLSLPPLESEKPPPSPLPSLQLSLQLSLLSESDATGAGGLAPATSRLTESMA